MLANFMLCFNGIMPLLMVMMTGYLLKRLRMIPEDGFRSVDMLCYKFFIPFVIFCSTRGADFSAGIEPLTLVYVGVFTALVFFLSFFIVKKFYPKEEAATLIHCWSQGNLAVIGVPLVTNLFGSEVASVFSLYMLVINLIINPLMVFEHNHFKGQKIKPWALIKKVFSSPYIIGSLTGVALALLDVRFPTFFENGLNSLKAMASPIALFSLGASFKFAEAKKYIKPISLTLLVKAIIAPAICVLPAVALGIRDLPLLCILIIFTCPTAVATYSMSVGIFGKPALGSQLVVFTTMASMVIIFAWLFVFLQLGLIAA